MKFLRVFPLIIAILAQPALASVTLNVGFGTMYASTNTSTPFASGGLINFLALESGSWDALPVTLGYGSLNEVFSNINSGFIPAGAVLIGQIANDNSGGAGITGGGINFSYSGNFNAGDQLLAVAYPTLTRVSANAGFNTPGFFFRTDSVIDGSDISWVAPSDGGTFTLSAYTQDIGGSVANNQFTSGAGAAGGNGFTTAPSSGGSLTQEFNVAAGQTATWSNQITGDCQVIKNGLGTQVLTASNSYIGGTLVSAGALVGDTTGLQGTITNNSTVIFNQPTTGTYSSVLSGTGSLTKSNNGTLILTGDNTQSGGTLVAGGTLQIGNGGTTGSLAGPITNNATLTYNRSDNITQSTVISGWGMVTKSGAGTLTLTGANTYAGGTLVSAGTLTGDTTGLQGTITNNSTVIFNQPSKSAGTYAGVLSGSGTLVKGGEGTLILTGANTQSGGTLIAGVVWIPMGTNAGGQFIVGSGKLQIGNGGTTGSLDGPITNNATLAYNRSDNITQSTVISGWGMVTKSGAGTLTLSGANTYAGGTLLNEGTLRAGNASAFGLGSVTIATNTSLDLAHYNIANTLVNNGGSITNVGRVDDGEFKGGDTAIDGDDSKIREISGDAHVRLGGHNTTVTNFTGGRVEIHGDGTRLRKFDGGEIGLNSGREIKIDEGNSSGRISGDGKLTKVGTGRLVLSSSNSYTGATTVSQGELVVNGSIAGSAVSVASGASLGGSGKVGSISGSGSVNPGNSPGILTSPSVDPSGGLSFSFEFTGLNPTFSNATASVNDLLRLTAATPFVASLTAGNIVNIYFNMASLNQGAYTGGFYTDAGAGAGNLIGTIANADLRYYVRGDGNGTDATYNGSGYYSLTNYDPSLEIAEGVTTQGTANFSDGTVNNGQITQFQVVPEPSTYALLGMSALGLGGYVIRRRRR